MKSRTAPIVGILIMFMTCSFTKGAEAVCLSPCDLAGAADGKSLYVACATANRVLCFDIATRKVVSSITTPLPPSGVALSPDQQTVFVTCAAPESQLCIVNLAKHKIVGTVLLGHTAMAPVLSADCKTLYVCNRFDNDIGVIDLMTKRERARIRVQREPVATDITKDGRFLLVANHLPAGRADVGDVAAVVSVVDLSLDNVVKELRLPSGSGGLKDLRVSPDGKYAVVTHVFSRFDRPTDHIYRGWINSNAMTLIDLARMETVDMIILDSPQQGAANPWGVEWSSNGAEIIVAHAGTHEISLIDFPKLVAQLARTVKRDKSTGYQSELGVAQLPTSVADCRRVKLPSSDLGPRAVVVVGNTVFVANYFSDTLSAINLSASRPEVESVPLRPKPEMSVVRKGEFYFHDARICLQGWQSCASCHPGEARVDGFNWDLLNDGIGSPKSTKSLLLSHKTPPAMSLGVRESAEIAVRSGIRHILFTQQPEEVAVSIDEYLKSLKPVPSPQLVKGKLSKAAERGQKVFNRAGCAACHPAGLFTDLRQYDVGTAGRFDKAINRFDTPTLVEVWRTAPYLHDGSAATVRDVVTTRNSQDRHGMTTHLTKQEVDELCEYVLSL